MAEITDGMARRAANKHGLRITKSRQRTQLFNNRGGYQLIDGNNIVVAGADYDLTADDVVAFLIHWQAGGRERHDQFMSQIAAEMAAQ